jgi:hypothetical protein
MLGKNKKDNGEITVKISPSDKPPKPKKKGIFSSRGFKYGSVATALTAVFILVVILANVVFSLLTDAFSWEVDVTNDQLYRLSDSTREIVNTLSDDDEIEITVFYEESGYPYYFSEPIRRISNLSDKITVNYVDPEINPAELTKYGTEYNIQTGAIVVRSGTRLRVFNVSDYYSVDEESGAMYFYVEERIAAGILYVTKDDIPVVYFVDGHGENGYESFITLFGNNGADVEQINLSQLTSFDPNSKVMVICNPTRDYSESEIRLLEDFLSNDNQLGRNLFYFSSSGAVELPNLERFLADWGISFNDDLVIESDENSAANLPYILIPQYTSEDIQGTYLTDNIMSYVPNSRSVNLLFEEEGLFRTTALLTTSTSSYSRPSDVVSNTWDKGDGDTDGPFNLSVMSTKYTYRNNIEIQSNVVACGSTDMLNAQMLNYSGTGEFLMSVYKVMVNEQDDTIVEAQKTQATTNMTLNSSTIQNMMIIVVIVIPGIFLILGLVVFIRRRFL